MYAKGTTVTVEKSQGQIQTLVRRHGATMYTAGWLAGGRAAVEFTIKGRRIRWTVPALNTARITQAQADAEERRRWRCLLLGIKAKLEIVATGISEFDEEFLAHVVTDNGATVWERVQQTKMLGPVAQ
jgi:hypothetical protein